MLNPKTIQEIRDTIKTPNLQVIQIEEGEKLKSKANNTTFNRIKEISPHTKHQTDRTRKEISHNT